MPKPNDSVGVLYKLSAKNTGTNAGCSATIDYDAATVPSSPSNIDVLLSPVHIQVSSDAAALVTIESPASTILFSIRFSAAFAVGIDFDPGDLFGTTASDLLVKVSASTSHCEAAITVVAVANPAGKSLSAPALDN